MISPVHGSWEGKKILTEIDFSEINLQYKSVSSPEIEFENLQTSIAGKEMS